MSTPPAPAAPLRADARRNRDQIIAAATETFAEHGAGVPMEDIARKARVGIGTLYRRFPDREALIFAVVRDSIEALLIELRRAAAEEPRAWDALVRALNRSCELKLSLGATDLLSPGLASGIKADLRVRQLRLELVEVLDGLVAAAQREGTLRDDVGTKDVTFLFTLVYRATSGGEDVAASRALGVLLDGLRAGTHHPLPGSPGAITHPE